MKKLHLHLAAGEDITGTTTVSAGQFADQLAAGRFVRIARESDQQILSINPAHIVWFKEIR